MSEVQPEDVLVAAERVSAAANRTPVMTSRTLNERCSRDVFLKCENFQRVGAFKFRGAYNAVSQLSRDEKARGVITHSSGNHAQGLALAARLLGVPATIVMPEDAPAIKRRATAGYGAQIVPCPAFDREEVTARLVEEQGHVLIHPYDNDRIIAGQGTAALELFDQAGELDLLFVPVGGGGLISGSALAAAAASPSCRVIGVEPDIAADANRSWRERRIHTLDHVPKTIADGLRTRHIGERNLTIMSRYVADMVTVSEEAIVETMRFLWERLKIIVEPSAAVALAPLFTGTYTGPGQRSGVLLSGGNVDFAAVPFLRQPVESAAFATAAERKVVTSPPDAAAQAQERPRVLVGCAINEESLELLQQVAEVDLRPNMDEATLQGLIGGYHGLIVGDETHVSGLAIEYGFNLRVIGCTGARLDNIDVSAARALGVEVRYSPGSNAVAVAEHTLGLLLSLSSRVYDEFGPQVGQGLAGKTLGLVGYGRIGRQVAKRAAAFDMRVLVNQPRLTPELALGRNIEVADLPDLLRQADFISLNVPFKAETDALLGRRELAMVKPQACLVNMTHTELVDDEALLAALNDGRLAGAALASFTPQVAGAEPRPAAELRAHPRVIAANHLTAFRDEKGREAALTVASQVVEILTRRRPNEALSLEVVSTDQVTPHEATDDKRVLRLMDRLEADGRLVNPPIVTVWENRYVILDGATRFTALARLGYPHIIVQVVPADSDLFALHTWYHAISSEEPFESLLERLRDIAGLSLVPMTRGQIRSAFSEEDALCYLLDRQGRVTLAQAVPGVNRLTVMNALVDAYSDWGTVERTLLTDLSRLLAQFPKMAVVAIFPQFTPETVFRVARRGDRLPAGLTRFVIPGRILRLNADLSRLRKEEPLTAKRAWFNRFLEDKLARSRLRYYQEPVILLDE